VAVFGFLMAATTSRSVLAQVHWDAAAHLGGAKRFVSDVPADINAQAPGVSPMIQVVSHVAIAPFVRAGLYGGVEFATDAAAFGPSRMIASGGLRAKVALPWPRGDARAWVFAGAGYAWVAETPGANGFFEAPCGVGAAYQVRKPWSAVVELGARPAFGHSTTRVRVVGDGVASGVDRLGVFAVIGLQLSLM